MIFVLAGTLLDLSSVRWIVALVWIFWSGRISDDLMEDSSKIYFSLSLSRVGLSVGAGLPVGSALRSRYGSLD